MFNTRFTVDTCDRRAYVLIGNSDTSLLLFLKGHVDKHVDSDRMFLKLWKGRVDKYYLT